MLLNVASVLVTALFANVLAISDNFPRPSAQQGLPSQCAKWRSGFEALKGATAYRLTGVQTQALQKDATESTLRRRITPDTTTVRIHGSSGRSGACGVAYDGSQHVGCLWNGAGHAAQTGYTSGWLTGDLTGKSNCFKKIWVQANGQTAYGWVTDSCNISQGEALALDAGCSSIYLSDKMLADLKFDNAVGAVQIDSWDFDQSTGKPW
ncbi:secreted protein [Melampsora americana]|nr:secreted protein [Melampsora americana]